MTSRLQALAAGAVGAATLTLVHEVGRRIAPGAPRMDVLGMRALRRLERTPGWSSSTWLRRLSRASAETRHRAALAGDLIANSLYYAAVPGQAPGETWMRAAVLGAAAGTGALLLPRPMGLGDAPRSERRDNQAMTIAWYLIGALAAAAAANGLRERTR
ncbi:MAG: hypothetical protein AB7N65_07180 [Vicinamibacterales bacterium]